MHKGIFISHLQRLMQAKCNKRSTQRNYSDKRIIDYRSRSLVLLVDCFSPTVTFRLLQGRICLVVDMRHDLADVLGL